ncbi:MAG: NRDE family protein [Wenzhouxiangellaceae bacterium]
MCTLVMHYQPQSEWPLLVAGNRDEMRDRPWQAPARHWPDRPQVIAGLDELAGGTWFGVNDQGVFASVLNRRGSLGPDEQRRSRGELVLEALDHAAAEDAATALADLSPAAYRGFNLIIGDAHGLFWLRHADDGNAVVCVTALSPGLHIIANEEINDQNSPRLAYWLPQWRQAALPSPEADDWNDWQTLLAQRYYPADDGPLAAMNIDYQQRYGTICSQLLAIPGDPMARNIPFLFAAGPPDQAEFLPVTD